MSLVKLGRKYKCIKDVFYGSKKIRRYIKDKTYLSEKDGCITDETGLREHYWINEKLFNEHFVLIYNKRRTFNDKNRRTI